MELPKGKKKRKKKGNKLSRHLSPRHFLPSFVLQRPVVAGCNSHLAARRNERRTLDPEGAGIGGISSSHGGRGNDLVGERPFLVVLSGGRGTLGKLCEPADRRGVLVQNDRRQGPRVHGPSLFALSPAPPPLSILSLFLATVPAPFTFRVPLLFFSVSPTDASLSLSLVLAFLSLSHHRPAALSLEREPLDGRTKAAGCFSPLLLSCLS